MMNRRKLLIAGSVTIPLILASCGNDEDSITDETDVSDNGGTTEQALDVTGKYADVTNDILMNGALTYGPEGFFVTKTVVLDLGSTESKDFYTKHKETLMNAYDNEYRGFGLTLVDYSDVPEGEGAHDHAETFAFNAASIAISVYQQDPELLWDYFDEVFAQLSEHEEGESEEDHHHAPDLSMAELADIAVGVGATDAQTMVNEFETTQTLARNMSMTVEGIVESTPALLENRDPFDGDVNDDEDVESWLIREY